MNVVCAQVLDTAAKRAKAMQRLVTVYLSKLEEHHFKPQSERPQIQKIADS